MPYLDDELELLNNLPTELKKNFLAMRSLDAEFEGTRSKLRQETLQFFGAFKNFPADERKKRFDEFQEGYHLIRELGEDKISIAEYIQLALEKYQEKVEKDLAEFKQELETDTPGITESIEKDLMTSIEAERNSRKNKVDTAAYPLDVEESSMSSFEDFKPPLLSTSTFNNFESFAEDSTRFSRLNGFIPDERLSRVQANNHPTSTTSNSNSHVLSSSTPLDEDIYDTEITPQKRSSVPPLLLPSQSASVSPAASTGTVDGAFFAHPFPPAIPPSQRANFSSGPRGSPLRMPSFTASSSSMHGRQRKLTKRVEQLLTSGGVEGEPSTSSQQIRPRIQQRKRRRLTPTDEEEEWQVEDEAFEEESEEEDDGDDKKWCICKQKSHGSMIACDNKQCKYEWFHWSCVGVTKAPIGKWFCPLCTATMNSRRSYSVESRD